MGEEVNYLRLGQEEVGTEGWQFDDDTPDVVQNVLDRLDGNTGPQDTTGNVSEAPAAADPLQHLLTDPALAAALIRTLALRHGFTDVLTATSLKGQ